MESQVMNLPKLTQGGALVTTARVSFGGACLLAGHLLLRTCWKLCLYQWKRPKYSHVPGIFSGQINLQHIPTLYQAMPLLMQFSKSGAMLDYLNLLRDPISGAIKPILFSGCSPQFKPQVVVSDGKYFGQILNDTTRFPKDQGLYRLFQPILGMGVVISFGERHKKQRKAITPVFHFAALKSAMKVIERNAAHYVDKELPASDFIISQDSFKNVTLDIITDYAFSGAFDKVWMRRAWQRIMMLFEIQCLFRIFIGDFLRYIPNPCNIYIFLVRCKISRYLSARRAHLKKHNISHDAVQRAVTSDQGSYTPSSAEGEIGIDLGMNLADQLILSGCPTSLIMDECCTFLMGGRDTTSHLLGWTARELTLAPKVQARIREELAAVLGPGPVRSIPFEAIKRLEYTAAVLKEALRLWPPIPQLPRVNAQPGLTIAGVAVPVGAVMDLNFWAAHRDPAVFPDPDAFRPERWLLPADSAEALLRHPYAFAPFSAGPRNCVGQKLAMETATVVLAALLSSYELEEACPGASRRVGPVGLALTEPGNLNVRCRPLAAGAGAGAAPAAAGSGG